MSASSRPCARSGKIARDELSGLTIITITSLSRLGGIESTPVINRPELAIIGVNRIVLQPGTRDGAVVARQVMNLSSSFEHRVVDGALAAGFVQCLRDHLEHPALFLQSPLERGQAHDHGRRYPEIQS